MVEKLTLYSLATALVDIRAVSMRPQLETSVALHILEWPFIVPSISCTYVMIKPFNQRLDMPHLAGGWIILTKKKCSLTGM